MLILGREHRIHHDLRNIVEMHDAPLLALLVEQVRDQFWLELKFGALGLIAQRNDLGDVAAVNLDYRAFGIVGVRPRIDFDRIRPHVIPAQPVAGRFAVSAAVKIFGDLVGFRVFA